MPTVSVILTSFNHAKYISEAIDSVLNQTFTDFELIIWDDASTDESWELINSYTDSRIIKFRNETTKRGVYGINKAITEISKAEYIAIHHSDDIWLPSKLEKQIDFLKNNSKYGAVFTNALAVCEDGSPLNDDQHFYTNIFTQANRSRYEWLNHFFREGNALCHPSVLIRKKCYDDCGLYRYGFAQLGDLDMWVRLCLKYEIFVIPEKLINFRVRSGEANSSGNTFANRSRVYIEYYFIIKQFLNIQEYSELEKIFPNAKKYNSNKKIYIEYVLAKMLLDEVSFALAKLFALEILLGLINDPVKAKNVYICHGFSSSDYVELTRKYGMPNIYLVDYESGIKQLEAAINDRDVAINERDVAINERDVAINERDVAINERDVVINERDKAINAYSEILQSRSYRLTAPLRIVGKLKRNIFSGSGNK